MRVFCLLPFACAAVATPAHADESAVARIADGIAMYRLTAEFCHWPISAKAAQVLDSDEKHFRAKNPVQFAAGVKSGTERHALLARSSPDYCHEVESSRGEMTQSLESRAR